MWYRKAADHGFADSQYEVAIKNYPFYETGNEMYSAFLLLDLAAKQGHREAQYYTGEMYDGDILSMFFGDDTDDGYVKCVVLLDRKKALDWYLKAARQGHPGAQYEYGEYLFYEEGKKNKDCEAFGYGWYQEAAEQGHISAQEQMGFMNATGRGVIQNLKEGAKWYKKAADQGSLTAQYNLALMYYAGEGVSKDKREAKKLFKNVADNALDTELKAAAQEQLKKGFFL